MVKQRIFRRAPALDLARVLLVHGDLTSRLALQTILRAGGYSVDVAATGSEALSLMDERMYDLVLSDGEVGDADGGRKILAYARIKAYRPATALIASSRPVMRPRRYNHQVAIHSEDLSMLLSKVADLIGLRASRRLARQLPAAV